jgi:CRISPR-associated protein Cmr1
VEVALARKAPDFPPALRSQPLSSAAKKSSYTIKVITPLFGGGVEPGKNDPETLIRGTSIRGHLRFWWRATCGAQCETPAQLAAKEGQIWGTTSEPSHVEIEVSNITKKATDAEDWAGLVKGTHLGYVLFPFQGSTRDHIPPAKCIRNLQFTLTLRYRESTATDVQAALWAWVNFGGIGARTRRGCGTLFCAEFAPPSADIKKLAAWLGEKQEMFKWAGYDTRPWPTLGSVYISPQPATPEKAWATAVDLLHKFRQGEIGRIDGRTCWPEAASIRSLRRRPDQHLNPAFPRARLGLPIIFQFKHEADLGTFELAPEDFTRMASPLILRPLAVGPNSALSMIVCLRTEGPLALGLTLLGKPNNQKLRSFSGTHFVARPDLAKYRNSPMQKRSRDGSALEAFFALAREEGFKELK